MGLSKTGCSTSFTKKDLEHRYVTGFVDGAKAVCSLILSDLETQKQQSMRNKEHTDVIESLDHSIKLVRDRLDSYSN